MRLLLSVFGFASFYVLFSIADEAEERTLEKRVFCCLTKWSGWRKCSNNCGIGTQHRERRLKFGFFWCRHVKLREERRCGQHNGGCQQLCRHDGYCYCKPGYRRIGNQCRQINECISNPCMNGGTCIDKVNGYVCRCKPGYEGKRCEKVTDKCKKKPCKHGKCIMKGTSFKCICEKGYEGILCNKKVHPCSNNPCKNGGKCIKKGDGYICQCKDGFEGKHCEYD